MLSVALLARQQPSATYLINRLQDVIDLQKVIYESWDGPPTTDTRSTRERIVGDFHMYRRYYRKRIREEVSRSRELEEVSRDTVFGHRWKQIEKPTPIVEVYDRDWQAAKAELEKEPPDLILVFGTGLIPDFVTEMARVACINVHAGLSPYYRGQNCTHFCILNEDFENIGVTAHLVRKAIDGGEILMHARPQIASGDNEFTLIKKNERVGAEVFCEIIEAMRQGKQLDPQAQVKDVGLLLMNRALTSGHKDLVRELIKGGAVERYLDRLSRGKTRPKPILESPQVVNTESPAQS